MRRVVLIVLDGVGIGAAPDAAAYGDVGSDTLGNTARAVGGLHLPALERLGLGVLAPIAGLQGDITPHAAHGILQPASAGKDSTTGHWEIAGLVLDRPFPTFPNGFPDDLVERFARATGRPVIGNVAGSGTEIIARYGEEQARTGAWILYTSADSVFQVAAHEAVIPLTELYAACATARAMLVPPHDASRVIARPFDGEPGAYRRTVNRKDFSLAPPGETLLDALATAGIARAGVGKVDDLFAGRGITSTHTSGNTEGIAAVRAWLRSASDGFLFANLVDFDQLYGHRNDARGMAGSLRDFDDALPTLLDSLRPDDLLILTADHGNDPTTASFDHARECVPLLIAGPTVRPTAIGVRQTFADLGATIADAFELPFRGAGQSFLGLIT